MQTIREDISQVKDLFREINADSRLTNKQVYSLLIKHAELHIYRESNRLNILKTSSLFGEVKCIPVILAPAIECKMFESDCMVYRTKYKLPKMFEDGAGPIISTVSSVDGWTQIAIVSATEIIRRRNNPWVKKSTNGKIYAYYRDGYIYFPDKKLDLVNVRGFFKESVINKSYCNEPCKECGKSCNKYLDQSSFIPGHLRAVVVQNVIQDLANTYAKMPEPSHEINKNKNSPS